MVATSFNFLAPTILAVLSSLLWRIAYEWTDWAVIALLPFAVIIAYGSWSLAIDPWRAKLHLVVRQESPLAKLLTGRFKAVIITVVFTVVAVTVLAWKAITASLSDGLIMCLAFFLASGVLSWSHRRASKHFHQPFDRSISVSTSTWVVFLIVFLLIAVYTLLYKPVPMGITNALAVKDAVQFSQESLPERGGWISAIFSGLYAYEGVKLWLAHQFANKHPLVVIIYSLDSALFSYVLCRSAANSTQLIRSMLIREQSGE